MISGFVPPSAELPSPPTPAALEERKQVSQAAAAQGQILQTFFAHYTEQISNPSQLPPLNRANSVHYDQRTGLVLKGEAKKHELWVLRENDSELVIANLFALSMPGSLSGAVQVRPVPHRPWSEYGLVLRSYEEIRRSFPSKNLPSLLKKAVLNRLSPHQSQIYKKKAKKSAGWFSPLLNAEQEKAYERAQKRRWSYLTQEGWQDLSFFTLHQLYLQEEIHNTSSLRVDQGPPTPLRSLPSKNLFDTPWGYKSETLSYSFPTLVKRYVPQMVLFEDLRCAGCLENVLNALDEDSIFALLLTLEYQMGDLHGDNIGFQFLLPRDLHDFGKIILVTQNKIVPLRDMHTLFTRKQSAYDAQIQIIRDGLSHTRDLYQLPQFLLDQGASVRVKLFDLGGAMFENNFIKCWPAEKKGISHVIPLRCDFLATLAARKPLSDALVQRLLAIQPLVEQTRRWMERNDSPIRQRLNKEDNAWLTRTIYPLLKTDNTSPFSTIPTYEVMPRAKHHKKLANLLFSTLNENFWQTLESKARLPARHFENVANKRRVCHQLVPRLTVKQMDHYMHRVRQRKRYLLNYLTLQRSPPSKDAMRCFLHSADSLLSATGHLRFLRFLNECPPEGVVELYHSLLYVAQPSLNNIARVMYPLLADYQEVLIALAPFTNTPSLLKVGNFMHDAHQTFDEAERTLSPQHEARHSLHYLQRQFRGTRRQP